MKSYARFYPKLLEQLEQVPSFTSREEAFNWLRDAWVALHVAAGVNKKRIQIMQGARLCAEQGWRDITKNVCHLTSPEEPPLRLYLHRDGTIVLQQMYTERNEIIFAKPGKVAAPAA